MNKKLNLIGLSKKAGRIVSGTEQVILEIRKHKIFLCIIANDAADNTIKKLTDKCKFYQTPYCLDFSGAELESILKSSKKVFGITDKHFSEAIINFNERIGENID